MERQEALIEFSYDGEKSNKEIWALRSGDVATVRRSGVSLLMSLREVGNQAAVWIDGRRLEPTEEELKDHIRRVELLRNKEKELRESGAYLAKAIDVPVDSSDEVLTEADLVDLPPIPEIRS